MTYFLFISDTVYGYVVYDCLFVFLKFAADFYECRYFPFLPFTTASVITV